MVPLYDLMFNIIPLHNKETLIIYDTMLMSY